MIEVDQAQTIVADSVRPLIARPVPLREARDCVLAQDVRADRDSPPFDKSLVDGYAIRSEDFAAAERPQRLEVVAEIMAGQSIDVPVASGQAVRIMTGAPLPPGTDAVVMQELCKREDRWVQISPDLSVHPGQNRLTRGREMVAGDCILKEGTRLGPVPLALLAAVGCVKPVVYPRPRVAIVATGDEIVPPEVQPRGAQIRDSNSTLLVALTEEWGAAAGSARLAPDQPERLREELARALDDCDLLVVTGGVSVGQRDLVPQTLASLRVTPRFHKVRLKPGKPLWFGIREPDGDNPGAGVPVFGLPGNPVSVLVGFRLFVRLGLERLVGRAPSTLLGTPGSRQPRAALASAYMHRGDRPTYHPARVRHFGGNSVIELIPWAGSADLRALADADALAVFPAGERHYSEGEFIRYESLTAMSDRKD